jgi:hypothetical protein
MSPSRNIEGALEAGRGEEKAREALLLMQLVSK